MLILSHTANLSREGVVRAKVEALSQWARENVFSSLISFDLTFHAFELKRLLAKNRKKLENFIFEFTSEGFSNSCFHGLQLGQGTDL